MDLPRGVATGVATGPRRGCPSPSRRSSRAPAARSSQASTPAVLISVTSDGTGSPAWRGAPAGRGRRRRRRGGGAGGRDTGDAARRAGVDDGRHGGHGRRGGCRPGRRTAALGAVSTTGSSSVVGVAGCGGLGHRGDRRGPGPCVRRPSGRASRPARRRPGGRWRRTGGGGRQGARVRWSPRVRGPASAVQPVPDRPIGPRTGVLDHPLTNCWRTLWRTS